MKTKSDTWMKDLSPRIGLTVGILLIAKLFFELSYDN